MGTRALLSYILMTPPSLSSGVLGQRGGFRHPVIQSPRSPPGVSSVSRASQVGRLELCASVQTRPRAAWTNAGVQPIKCHVCLQALALGAEPRPRGATECRAGAAWLVCQGLWLLGVSTLPFDWALGDFSQNVCLSHFWWTNKGQVAELWSAELGQQPRRKNVCF